MMRCHEKQGSDNVLMFVLYLWEFHLNVFSTTESLNTVDFTEIRMDLTITRSDGSEIGKR